MCAAAIYRTADAANDSVLVDQLGLAPAFAASFKQSLVCGGAARRGAAAPTGAVGAQYEHFARANELLRHFWLTHWRPAAADKVARIVVALRAERAAVGECAAARGCVGRGDVAPRRAARTRG